MYQKNCTIGDHVTMYWYLSWTWPCKPRTYTYSSGQAKASYISLGQSPLVCSIVLNVHEGLSNFHSIYTLYKNGQDILDIYLRSARGTLQDKYLCTVCPRSLGPYYVVAYYIRWAKTSWTYSILGRIAPASPLCSL